MLGVRCEGAYQVTRRCIVSCCHSENLDRAGYYAGYADRLERSLDKFGMGAARRIWRSSWPTGSPSHAAHNYAFKVYAVAAALKEGFDRVMWLDSGCELIADIKPLWDHIDARGHGILSAWDTLGEWVSDEALARYGVSRDEAMALKLGGGCYVGVATDSEVGMKFYNEWMHLASKTNMFAGYHSEGSSAMRSLVLDGSGGQRVSADPRVKGHRSDEACFALYAHVNGLPTLPLVEFYRVARTY
jgi:hypothetical protein